VRLALAQYRELAAFSQFASDLDEFTRKQLDRGQRVMELMKQKQYAPLSIADMAISLFAANEGFLDDVDVKKIGACEAALHSYFQANAAALRTKINESGDLNADIESGLKKLLTEFKANGVY
jgi:F-type H+/Na+-transporting ATPase subunit alpha